jgi:hypothetical protein
MFFWNTKYVIIDLESHDKAILYGAAVFWDK